MPSAVLVICDGLRADMVTQAWTPNLHRLARDGRRFTAHRSVFPSTTRTTSASIATGCRPGRHGLSGNVVALDEGDGLVALSAGPPDFRDRLRAATGRTLRVPTLAERVADDGGSIVFSNVSAGAALFQDPDGYGHVYHRLGSFGPGPEQITGTAHLDVSHDAAGDTAMTERFCEEVLGERKPALAVLWLCEPDHSQHVLPLGSPEHLGVVAAADANAARVAATVAELNEAGDDVLLVCAADHGHETVAEIIPLEDMLIEAGLKDGAGSGDVVVASNVFSAAIYLSDEARPRLGALIEFLEATEGIDGILAGDQLQRHGLPAGTALAIAVTTRKSDAANPFGIPGLSDAIDDPLGGETHAGCGQHGGLGRYEQNPFLIVVGGGFAAGSEDDGPTSAIDIAPTVLRHLGLDWNDMDGTPLERG